MFCRSGSKTKKRASKKVILTGPASDPWETAKRMGMTRTEYERISAIVSKMFRWR